MPFKFGMGRDWSGRRRTRRWEVLLDLTLLVTEVVDVLI